MAIYSSNHKSNRKVGATHASPPHIGEIIKDDWLVNDDTIGGCNQATPAISSTKSGYVLAWVDYRNGHDPDIYCALCDSECTVDSVLLVNENVVGAYQSSPAVSADSSGNFVVVWLDSRNGTNDVYCQRYDAVGAPIGANFRVNDDPIGKCHYDPSVGVGVDGEFVVAWRDDRGPAPDIYAQIYDASGSPIGTNLLVNDDSVASVFQHSPSIAKMGTGEFAIVWIDNRTWHNDVYCQRWTSAGVPIGSNFKVNDNPSGTNMQNPHICRGGKQYAPTYIIWDDYRDHMSYPQIYCQIYDSLWLPIGANFRVNDDSIFARHEVPSCAADSSGNLVVVWSDKRESLTMPDVYAQRYDKLGNPVGANFKVNTDSAGEQWQVLGAVGVRAGGDFLVVWESHSGKDSEIIAQKYTADGAPVDSNFSLVPDEGMRGQCNSKVAMCDEYGVITWEDERLDNTAVFAQLNDAVGEPINCNFKVNDDTSRVAHSPSCAVRETGFVVVWVYRKTLKQVQGKDVLYPSNIYARKYNSTGEPVDSEFRVDMGADDAPRGSPEVAIDTAGNFVVVWEDGRIDSKRPDIYARRYYADGSPADTNFAVNEYLGKDRNQAPSVAMSPLDAGFIVVWQGGKGDVGLFDIWGQRYDSIGTPVGANFEISDDPIAQDQQTNPSVAIGPNGGMVVWEDTREGNQDIYVQLYDAMWQKVGANFRITDDTYGAVQGAPSCAVHPITGEFIITWTDYRDGNPQIIGQKLNNYGAPIGANFRVNNPEGEYHLLACVAASAERILISWTDNRRKKGYDIYAKLVGWVFPGVEERAKSKEERAKLEVYPNPGCKELAINYNIVKSGNYRILIYDKTGRKVDEVDLGHLAQGRYTTALDIAGFSSGIYFVNLNHADANIIEKIVVFR